MTNEIAVQENNIAMPMTIQNIKEQVRQIQSVLKEVMLDGQHYGIIPGCGSKPTLLKAGAEKILMTFRLRSIINCGDIEIVDMGNAHREYRVSCHVLNYEGVELATGIGCASTMEKKFLRDNPPDVYNTVLKMAKKRAQVDGTLSATAASDIFTQDVEDMDSKNHSEKPKPSTPKPIETGAQKINCIISKVFDKKSEKAPQSFGIKSPDGGKIEGYYQTFDVELIKTLTTHYKNEDVIELSYHTETSKDGKYTNNVIDGIAVNVEPQDIDGEIRD